MEDLTVLSEGNDPYRFDTPAKRRDGQWLATEIARLGVRLPLHPRGIHYALVATGDVIKPNGKLYINDFANWDWLTEAAAAARWNGFILFTHIRDDASPILKLSE